MNKKKRFFIILTMVFILSVIILISGYINFPLFKQREGAVKWTDVSGDCIKASEDSSHYGIKTEWCEATFGDDLAKVPEKAEVEVEKAKAANTPFKTGTWNTTVKTCGDITGVDIDPWCTRSGVGKTSIGDFRHKCKNWCKLNGTPATFEVEKAVEKAEVEVEKAIETNKAALFTGGTKGNRQEGRCDRVDGDSVQSWCRTQFMDSDKSIGNFQSQCKDYCESVGHVVGENQWPGTYKILTEAKGKDMTSGETCKLEWGTQWGGATELQAKWDCNNNTSNEKSWGDNVTIELADPDEEGNRGYKIYSEHECGLQWHGEKKIGTSENDHRNAKWECAGPVAARADRVFMEKQKSGKYKITTKDDLGKICRLEWQWDGNAGGDRKTHWDCSDVTKRGDEVVFEKA